MPARVVAISAGRHGNRPYNWIVCRGLPLYSGALLHIHKSVYTLTFHSRLGVPPIKPKRNRNRTADGAPPATGLGALLEIPPSSLSGISQMEIAGNREAVIAGCQGVLEYDENVIKLTTGKMSIRFMGRGLQIKVLTHDSAVVTGFITNIEFIT